MHRHPIVRLASWAGILVAAMLILASCGDDSGSVPFAPPTDAPQSTPLESAPDNTDDPGEPAGLDRRAELIGSWEIVNYTLTDGGSLTNIVGDVTPFIEFMADGTLAFQTGCNRGDATWEASGSYTEPSPLDDDPEGQPIRIDDISKDTAACDGFLGEQDADLAAHLEAAERFLLIDSGGMSLLAEFVLIRAETAT
jgi:hypothetical protein